MADTEVDGRLILGGKAHENTRDYISGLLAAVRTHKRLTGKESLAVQIDARAKLPLAQSLLLK